MSPSWHSIIRGYFCQVAKSCNPNDEHANVRLTHMGVQWSCNIVAVPLTSHLSRVMEENVSAFCRWIVRADPEAGLEMFTEMQPPLAPEVALPILTSEAPSLCAPYLQAALASNTAAPERFHTELALIYLRSTLEQHKHGGAAAAEEQRGELHSTENGHAKAPAPSLPARPDPLVSLKELVRSRAT